MLDRIKQALGLASVDAYERDVLEREYRRIEDKLEQTERQLGTVHCSSCVKEEEPQAKRLMSKRRRLEKRQAEIEKKLGGPPKQVKAKRRQASKRASS